MQDMVVGILAIAAGALFCFRGFIALRVMIPIWGTFAGFMLGAGLIAGTGDAGFLRTGLSWMVGVGFGLVFGLLAYLYYEVSIVLAMASIGFALGTSLMVALGASWSWLIILVGIAVGVLLAMVAIAGDLPGFILMLLGAMAGSSAIVTGLMLFAGAVNTEDFTSKAVTQRLKDSWWWYAIYLVLVVSGIIVQSRELDRLRLSTRTAWAEAGGKELRKV
ncbi:MAG: DUF4203 domain-containing protein [Microthrixaceae bacterium]